MKSIDDLLDFLVPEFNYFVTDKGEDDYDYKSEFKSSTDVKKLRNSVIKAFEKDRLKGLLQALHSQNRASDFAKIHATI